MDELKAFYGPNAGYVLDLYDQYQRDPGSVDARTRALFEAWGSPNGGGDRAVAFPTPAPTADGYAPDVDRIVGAAALAVGIREYGHLGARLDPLESVPPGDPELEPQTHGIQEADLAQLPSSVVGGPVAQGARSALDGINALRRVYCDTTGYDYDHIHNAEERVWLRDAAETGRFRPRMVASVKRQLLKRLTQVEAFEQFLHRTFPGQKRFSIEGADMLVPMLDDVIRCQTVRGNREVLIGMAHRGRLNVLTHVLEKPYHAILTEFERADQRPAPAASEAGDRGWTGDVKYHLGARWPGRGNVVQISITLAPNPSHLEFVNPVVEGMARAAQDRRDQPGPPTQDLEAALAILIHGDAAFPGEGVVAETLNMSRLEGYQTGGTVHIIVNNQIGFTTEPREGRSTLYAGDLAKGFEIPIVHVNADDPEACLAAARMACAYRDRFHKDFLIDLIGYRRWGHNEGDEPAFTQPRMYAIIREHPTVRQIWAGKLEQQGVITAEETEAMYRTAFQELEAARGQAGGGTPEPERHREQEPTTDGVQALNPSTISGSGSSPSMFPQQTASDTLPLSSKRLSELNEALHRFPEGFTLNPRLGRAMERRRAALGPEGDVDWGHAEALAFACILVDGTPVRLTGQDVERGTFSQRHLVLHDAVTGGPFTPLQALPDARASFAVYNSPLSENGPLGFEYGYSVHSPTVLVLWEAQFGDFVNAGQVIIDQFIAAARAKWRQAPGLALLLPHGYEGQGPEHSSARLERFLQLAANDNLNIVNCTTAAQYFHLLRRQASRLRPGPGWAPQPLVVMTPKSLLRHPRAASRLEEFVEGAFQAVIDEGPPAPGDRDAVARLILCSGKIAVDLAESEFRPATPWVAIAKVEELYPFPRLEIQNVIARYPRLQEVVWVQEEPENMGACTYLAPRLHALVGSGIEVRSIARPRRASPATGSMVQHRAEQTRIVAAAFGSAAGLGVSKMLPGATPEPRRNGDRAARRAAEREEAARLS